MIKVNVKSKKNDESIVYGTVKPVNTNRAELMVVIGMLSELAMKKYGVSKMEMLDFIKKRG